MGFIIDDGMGSGTKAQVSDDNMLRTYAKTESEISHESENHGRAFTWSNVTYDPAAGDTILLIKNTSPTLGLIIQHFSIGSDVNTVATIHSPTCAIPTGTAVTGVNLNRQSGKTAEATAICDETTNSQANVMHNVYVLANTSTPINTEGSLILGLNDCVAVDFVADVGACYVSIKGYYHDVG